MNCLLDFIGVKNCGNAASESGLWVNDLPGVNLKVIEGITDAEQATFLETWASIQRRSLKIFSTTITAVLNKRYQLKTLNEFTSLPAILDTGSTTAPANEKRGFTVKIGDTQYVSALQYIHVQSLRLYLASAGSTTIRFYNVAGDIFTEVHTIAVTGVSGWNNIVVNADFVGVSTLFVGYDAAAITSVESKLDTSLDCDCEASYNCCDTDCCGMTIQAAKWNGTDITYGNNLFGLTGIISLRCGFTPIVCSNKTLFATSLWYLLGREIMQERIYTDRINRYTTIDLNKAKDLKVEFDRLYSEELGMVLDGFKLPVADCCLECNAPIVNVTMLP